MKKVQQPNGEWVQRYNHKAQPHVSRPKETDCLGLVLSGICYHYNTYKDKNFIKTMLPSIKKALEYLEKKTKNHLVYGQHAIHETPLLEDGFEIWTNSWVCRAYRDLSEVFFELGDKKLSKKLETKHVKMLKTIMEKFWNGKHFIKLIKTNGKKITARDISMISPAWAEILPAYDIKIKKTVKYLRPLWDKKIGGYRRYDKFKIVKDWHWYDGGHGSWLIYTIVMASIHSQLNQKKEAKECVDWIKKVYKAYKDLPEHVALKEEFDEWEREEWKRQVNITKWLTCGAKKAKKLTRTWTWNHKQQKVIPWVLSLNWPEAEFVLNFEHIKEFW